MNTVAWVWIAIAGAAVAAPLKSPDRAAEHLFDSGIKLVQKGRFGPARITFETIVRSYPSTRVASDAKYAVDATDLLEEAQGQMRAGRFEAAKLRYKTLLCVYPESRLVAAAHQGMRAADDALAYSKVVRTIRFEVAPLSEREILQRFEEREVALRTERTYDPRDVEEAKAILGEMASERGAPRKVEAAIREDGRRVEVTFRLVE